MDLVKELKKQADDILKDDKKKEKSIDSLITSVDKATTSKNKKSK